MSNVERSLGENAEELREKAYRSNRTIEKAPEPFDSWFEVDVALQIAGNGFRVIPQYEFADKRIDLVVQGQKAQLAVECDGDFWHGVDAYTADTERQRKLERCGWHFFRVRESRYYANPDAALEPLWLELNNMGIKSYSNETKEEFETDDNYEDIVENETTDEYPGSLFDTNPTIKEPNGRPETKESIDENNNTSSPENIQQAIKSKSALLNEAIIQVLEQRPNFSNVQEKIPTYILKLWEIRSRGNPRKIFINRVNEQIRYMNERGYVIIYKSKNIRVKLGRVKYKIP